MTEILSVFAKNLRAFRQRAGLSQEELAHRAGLHRTYIGPLERGERNVSLKTLENLARALGVSPEKLLAEDTTPIDSE